MSPLIHEFEFSMNNRLPVPLMFETTISGEGEGHSSPQLTFSDHDLWFSGMARVPRNISDVIVEKLTQNPNVSAIRIGRSGDVYHVWTMIRNWTAADRKAVYAAQKELLKKLQGFELDFYVVQLDAGTSSDELVSDIPMAFPVPA